MFQNYGVLIESSQKIAMQRISQQKNDECIECCFFIVYRMFFSPKLERNIHLTKITLKFEIIDTQHTLPDTLDKQSDLLNIAFTSIVSIARNQL